MIVFAHFSLEHFSPEQFVIGLFVGIIIAIASLTLKQVAK